VIFIHYTPEGREFKEREDMSEQLGQLEEWKSSSERAPDGLPDNTLWGVKLKVGGQISVLRRWTGFEWRDVETGYRSKEGHWYLATDFDIRNYQPMTEEEAIQAIVKNATFKDVSN
jgi:hypothetical protein